MSHELFVIDQKPNLDQKDEHRAEYLLEKLVAAEEVGVISEAQCIRDELLGVEWGSLIIAAPLTEDELTIWGAWLPTAYVESNDPTAHKLWWYNFDRIPAPVLKKWHALKKAKVFECYEIWTPEVQRPDPILLGVNGTVRHLIARWGESDANLVTFDDIKRELLHRLNRLEVLRLLCAAGLLAAVYVLMWSVPPGDVQTFAGLMSWGLWGFLFGSIGFSLYNLKNDPLRTAIKNHRTVDREMLHASA